MEASRVTITALGNPNKMLCASNRPKLIMILQVKERITPDKMVNKTETMVVSESAIEESTSSNDSCTFNARPSLAPPILLCPFRICSLYQYVWSSHSGCGKREAHINWSLMFISLSPFAPENQSREKGSVNTQAETGAYSSVSTVFSNFAHVMRFGDLGTYKEWVPLEGR